jgi:hypothetical protein
VYFDTHLLWLFEKKDKDHDCSQRTRNKRLSPEMVLEKGNEWNETADTN